MSIIALGVLTPLDKPVHFSIYGIYNGQIMTESFNQGITLFWVTIMLTFFILTGKYILKEAVKIDAKKTTAYENKNIWWFLAFLQIVKQSVSYAIAAIIFIPICLATVSIFVSGLFMNNLEFSMRTLIFVAGLIVCYPIFIILKKIGAGLKKASDKYKPTFELKENGFDLSFHWMGMKQDEGKFHVDFSELEKIKTMSFFEAQNYEKELGPNVLMGINQAKSMYKMGKERPQTMIMPESGTNVLIKGPEIHYLFKFRSDQNVEELINQFNQNKNTN